jgi:hypothetical protein
MSGRRARPSILLIFVAALACGCGWTRPPSLDRAAQDYVRAALQLAQHDPSLVESWRGPASLEPGARVPVADVMERITSLQRDIDLLASDISNSVEKRRIDYLDAQVRGLRLSAERLLGRATSIDDQARDEFAMAFSSIDQARVQQALAGIDRLLPGSAPLASRVAGFRNGLVIPPDRRMAVMEAALAACRDAVAPLIDLPDNDRVTLAFKKGLAWDAFARYEGGGHTAIDINDDSPLDVSRAARLACHEGYAGHHAQHVLIDRAVSRQPWPELQLTPAFGRHLLFAEGAAEVGADLALPDARRAALYRETLFPTARLDPVRIGTLIGLEGLLPELLPIVTDVARRYLDGPLAREAAIDRLRDEALLTNPAGTLAFIEKRRARALVYIEGRRAIYSMMPSKDLAGLKALVPGSALQ